MLRATMGFHMIAHGGTRFPILREFVAETQENFVGVALLGVLPIFPSWLVGLIAYTIPPAEFVIGAAARRGIQDEARCHGRERALPGHDVRTGGHDELRHGTHHVVLCHGVRDFGRTELCRPLLGGSDGENDLVMDCRHRGRLASAPSRGGGRIALLSLALGVFLLPGSALAQTTFTHVHMRVPDTAEAAAWHQALLGGEIVSRGPGQAVLHRNGMVMTMVAEGETHGARAASSITLASPSKTLQRRWREPEKWARRFGLSRRLASRHRRSRSSRIVGDSNRTARGSGVHGRESPTHDGERRGCRARLVPSDVRR